MVVDRISPEQKVHHNQCQSQIRDQLVSGVNCDVNLVCSDGVEHCHAVMLAAASPFWHQILDGIWPGEVTIILFNITRESVRRLLTFLYTGMRLGDWTCQEQMLELISSLLPDIKMTNQMEDNKEKEMDGCLPSHQRETRDNLVSNSPTRDYAVSDSPTHIEETDMASLNRSLLDSVVRIQKDNKSCPECGKTFLYPKDLKKHRLVHQKIAPFSCSICGKSVRTISNMYRHLRQKHDLTDNLKSYILDVDSGESYIHPEDNIKRNLAAGNIDPTLLDPNHVMEQGCVGQNKNGVNLYKCLICEKSVAKYSLKNHLAVHSGDDKYQCQLCPRSYFTSSALANHQVIGHEEKKSPDQVIRCATCYRSFRTTRVRDQHATNCLQLDPEKRRTAFECRMCNKLFGYRSNLVSHQKNVHGLEGRKILDYPCKYCGLMVKGKLKLSKHIITVHPDEKGELCDLCGKNFRTEKKLLRHIAVHKSRERNLHCSFCPKKFFRLDVLTVHEKVHISPVICQECGKKFPEKRYLNTHINQSHKEKLIFCLHCYRSFSSDDLLKKHSAHCNISPISYSCHLCSQVFHSKAELERHKQTQSDHFPLQCPTCSKGFLLDSQLEKHIDQVHTKVGPSQVHCQHCDIPLTSLYSLKRHLSRHKCPLVSGEQDCSVCFKDQETFYRLRNHIRLNESKKVLPCDKCDKKFKTLQELKVHSVVHTGERPFSCQLCGEKFTQKCSLLTHISRHKAGTVGSNNLICHICNKVCRTFAALKSHIKSHLGPEVHQFPQIEMLDQIQVVTEGQLDQMITIDPVHLSTIDRSGPLELVGDTGEYRIQIMDDISNHIQL